MAGQNNLAGPRGVGHKFAPAGVPRDPASLAFARSGLRLLGRPTLYFVNLAGPRGVEPLTAVLETAVIPFNQGPTEINLLLFAFLVRCVFAALFAMLLERKFCHRLNIRPCRNIISLPANAAFQNNILWSFSFFCHCNSPLFLNS